MIISVKGMGKRKKGLALELGLNGLGHSHESSFILPTSGRDEWAENFHECAKP
jgi:hypothetical protein